MDVERCSPCSRHVCETHAQEQMQGCYIIRVPARSGDQVYRSTFTAMERCCCRCLWTLDGPDPSLSNGLAISQHGLGALLQSYANHTQVLKEQRALRIAIPTKRHSVCLVRLPTQQFPPIICWNGRKAISSLRMSSCRDTISVRGIISSAVLETSQLRLSDERGSSTSCVSPWW